MRRSWTQFELALGMRRIPYYHHYADNSALKLDTISKYYVSTIRETVFESPPRNYEDGITTPNFYEMLVMKDCLPEGEECTDCIRNPTGSTCEMCKDVCPCYCSELCHVTPEKKFVKKQLHVSLPPYRKHPDHLIPRIVHQTWFEPLTRKQYPNLSRLTESWKHSGWDYRFHNEMGALEFLTTHFPPEVAEAYQTLIPSAFKAELYRYCILFIFGGIYADIDILLESNLDSIITKDVGFMAPMDSPGNPPIEAMCLWNGMFAAAPGHPFLAKVIEMIVNNVRNRYTQIDIENMMCPNPNLSLTHRSHVLFSTGPCILGSAVNFVLRRHLQEPIKAGELPTFTKKNFANVNPIVLHSVDHRQQVPGKTIILLQNKGDMGAHRFTMADANVIVAATDLSTFEDKENLEEKKREHYAKVRVSSGIYGLEGLYVDSNVANEDIEIIVEGEIVA